MKPEDVAKLVARVSLEEQAAVREFVNFLRERRAASPSPFLAAVDEFIAAPPELLRRLAQ